MGTKELLDEAMKLKPEERLNLVEGLIKNLDEPDKKFEKRHFRLLRGSA